MREFPGYRRAARGSSGLQRARWTPRTHCPYNRARFAFSWSMIFPENRSPPRIKSEAGFFGVML
jgi:hypothetical protein